MANAYGTTLSRFASSLQAVSPVPASIVFAGVRMMSHVVDAVIRDLSENPRDWVVDKYRLTHVRNGVSIWIASGSWGLEIDLNGIPIWGGVTSLSALYLSAKHRRLHRAVKRWKEWFFAQAMEARRAETGTGSVRDSAVPEGNAP